MEKKKSNIGYIIIIVLLVLGFVGYVLFDQGLIKFDKSDKDVEEKEEKKELDVNSRLVQNLYNMVTTDDNYFTRYWMYSIYGSGESGYGEDFFADKSSEEIKMNIVGINLHTANLKYNSCNDISIPDDIKKYPFVSEFDHVFSQCKANSLFGANDLQAYYDRKYIESVYKTIFGKDAKLDTSVLISTDHFRGYVYNYIEEYDAYYRYNRETGGTGGSGGFDTYISKAYTEDKKLVIYEDVKLTYYENEDLNKPCVEEWYYIYTFELEDDGMYKFVSRVKEDKE